MNSLIFYLSGFGEEYSKLFSYGKGAFLYKKVMLKYLLIGKIRSNKTIEINYKNNIFTIENADIKTAKYIYNTVFFKKDFECIVILPDIYSLVKKNISNPNLSGLIKK